MGGRTGLWLLAGASAVSGLAAAGLLVRRGMQWGSTDAEQAVRMPGDAYLEGGPPTRVVMTRAVSIAAPPETVWPWLAQLGRGAGWYSIDRFDNGGRASARHLVSWIPPPEVGDATAIGYLRDVDPGRSLTWWLPGTSSLGARMRMITDMHVEPEDGRSRLTIRISGDAAGWSARPLIGAFTVVDSIMARQQLLGVKARVEMYGTRGHDPQRPETGARDQFQVYEVILASGDRAGLRGRESGPKWRAAAIADGALAAAEEYKPGP